MTALVLLLGRPALAQTNGGALERFTPAPAGDAFFGVASAAVGGHLVPRASAIVDFAYHPLSIQFDGTRSVIVSQQTFLHLDASFALWDRVLVSADMPFALAQGGDAPTVGGVAFPSPSGAQAGDLRLGARVRLYGDYWKPFQIGVGGYVYVPTAPSHSYAGDGEVRGRPQVVLGGRASHFVWSASLGTELRASTHPHTFEAGAAAALVLGKELLQIGPELTMAVPFSSDQSLSTSTLRVASSSADTEIFLGAKVRPLRPFVVGAGAGTGLTHGYGSPQLFAVASLGYEPLPPKVEDIDTDRDGIPDREDACPDRPGPRDPDPKKNGCPADRDGDGIADADDACPDVKGVPSDDPKKNGCPADRDGDGIPDPEDACPDVKGVRSEDPKLNGCPPDRDGDGILDAEDACPDVKGIRSDDPKKNGCPPDSDGDGIPDPEDACPDRPGPRDPDPKKNGCPLVVVTETEIQIRSQVKFLFGQADITQTVDPVSETLLTEVRDAIHNHPEIEVIEVQGHADEVGTQWKNLALSQARASAVRDWLIRRGIATNRLKAKGYGSKVPLVAGSSEEARQQNRRVQFVVIKRSKAKP